MKAHIDADFETFVDYRRITGTTLWHCSYNGCAICQDLNKPVQAFSLIGLGRLQAPLLDWRKSAANSGITDQTK